MWIKLSRNRNSPTPPPSLPTPSPPPPVMASFVTAASRPPPAASFPQDHFPETPADVFLLAREAVPRKSTSRLVCGRQIPVILWREELCLSTGSFVLTSRYHVDMCSVYPRHCYQYTVMSVCLSFCLSGRRRWHVWLV